MSERQIYAVLEEERRRTDDLSVHAQLTSAALMVALLVREGLIQPGPNWEGE